MTTTPNNLSDLLSPITTEEFFAQYHGKKPLHIKGAADKFAGVMDWDILSALLNQNNIWTGKSLELALQGQKIEVPHYCTPAIDRDGRQNMLADMGKVKSWLQKGASLVANDIDNLHPGVKQVASLLEREIGGKVQGNLYCSWAGSQGFGSHFDTHDVYAVHVQGKKTWRIYTKHFDDPIAHPSFTTLGQEFHDKHKGEVTMEVTLEPGDLLYIPRGWYHDALAQSEATIHVAFGLTSAIGMDLVTHLFERAVADAAFRKTIPRDEASRAKHLKMLGQKLADFTAEQQVQDNFSGFIDRFHYPRDTLSLPGDIVQKRYRVRGNNFQVVKVKGVSALSDGKQGVPIPGGMEKPVSWVLDHLEFTEEKLAAEGPDMPDGARKKFLQDLQNMRIIEVA